MIPLMIPAAIPAIVGKDPSQVTPNNHTPVDGFQVSITQVINTRNNNSTLSCGDWNQLLAITVVIAAQARWKITLDGD